jgi:hypothetical protein
MAKAPKPSTHADSGSLQSTHDWMPHSAAFLHIQQVVGGGEQLAAEDLRLRFLSGDVEAQNRRVTPGGIDIIPLTPEFFRDTDRAENHLSALSDSTEAAGGLTRDFALPFRRITGESFFGLSPLDGHNIFLRRADVYRIWPIGGEAKKPREAALPRTRPTGIGPKAWLTANKVWELWREGYRWPDRESLLRKVRDRIGNDGLSMRILDQALAYLRQKRLIDR